MTSASDLRQPEGLCWRALQSRTGGTGTGQAAAVPKGPYTPRGAGGPPATQAACAEGAAVRAAEPPSQGVPGAGQELVFISGFPGF